MLLENNMDPQIGQLTENMTLNQAIDEFSESYWPVWKTTKQCGKSETRFIKNERTMNKQHCAMASLTNWSDPRKSIRKDQRRVVDINIILRNVVTDSFRIGTKVKRIIVVFRAELF